MHPWCIPDELLKEFCGSNHPGKPPAGISHLGNSSLNEVPIFVIHWHLPHLLPGAAGSRKEGVNEPLIVTHDTGPEWSQCNPCSTGQRCDIDQVRRPEASRISERVGQNETPLG